jgi:hypothetical protein
MKLFSVLTFELRKNFMLKKPLLFALLLSTSAFSFASNMTSATLTVAPYNPSNWGYMNATVSDTKLPRVVSSGITFPVSVSDTVSLIKVAAMNVYPQIDGSCRNVQMHEGPHQLVFELKKDWLIHCRYS